MLAAAALAAILCAHLPIGCLRCASTQSTRQAGIAESPATTKPAVGWTELGPLKLGARSVYVSASGADTNDGLTPEHAKRTFKAGYALIRDGAGDRLLLRRGDVFELHDFLWERSGASPSAPAVIGAYGDGPRPVLRSGSENALHLTAGYQAPHSLAHVAVMDLDIIAERRNPSDPTFDPKGNTRPLGIVIGASDVQANVEAEDVVIEGCRIQWFSTGITSQGDLLAHPNVDIRIRRNVISNIYCSDAGNCTNVIYVEGTKGLLIEENLIDSQMQGQVPSAVAVDMNHAIYAQSDTSGIVVRGNIFARVPDAGMLRSGGEYSGNLVVRAGIGATVGFIFGGATPVARGVSATITGNAFVDSSDTSPRLPRGTALILGNIKSGTVRDNVMMHDSRIGAKTGVAISLHGERTQVNGETNIGVHDLTVENNSIYDWPGWMDATDGSYENVTIRKNSFHMSSHKHFPLLSLANLSGFTFRANNWYSPGSAPFQLAGKPLGFDQWSRQAGVIGGGDTQLERTFSDPERSLASYDRSSGGSGTLEDFLKKAREQARDRWLPQYTAAPIIQYLRDGLRIR